MIFDDCKDCTRRHVGCHAECGEYLTARAKLDRAKAAEQAGKNARAILAENYHNRLEKFSNCKQSIKRRRFGGGGR